MGVALWLLCGFVGGILAARQDSRVYYQDNGTWPEDNSETLGMIIMVCLGLGPLSFLIVIGIALHNAWENRKHKGSITNWLVTHLYTSAKQRKAQSK